MRLIGWLCVMGAGISLIGGLLSAHFAPCRRRPRREFRAFLEAVPGFIPGLVIAAVLLTLGFLILMTLGLGSG